MSKALKTNLLNATVSTATLTLFSLTLLFSVACGGEDADTAAQNTSYEKEALIGKINGEIIARVNGHKITRARLSKTMERSGEKDPAIALKSLIKLELLSAEALKRGLDSAPRVHSGKEHLLVQRLLEKNIEEVISEKTLPPELVQKAYNSFAFDLFEPELVTVSHILIPLHPGIDDATRKRADRLGEEIYQALIALPKVKRSDLNHLGLRASLKGLSIKVEHNITFPREPIPSLGNARPRFPAVVEPFAKAGFALSAESPIGAPVWSSFGLHIILFLNHQPAIHPPFEMIRPLLSEQIILAQRKKTTQKLITGLLKDSKVFVSEEPLLELADQLFGAKKEAPETL